VKGDAGTVDTEELWRRVGLARLREALARVGRLSQEFERLLAALPPCDACARAALLKRLREAGTEVSSEAIYLSVLAQSLHKAVEETHHADRQLGAVEAEPCRCPGGPCTCHGPQARTL